MEETSEVIFNFFKTFSRFEYALKRVGYNSGDGMAKADWKQFIFDINNKFKIDADQKLKESVDYILNNPPNKQVVEDGQLAWSSNEPDAKSETELLFQYIKRVRNNLFHGGKYNGKYLEDPTRSYKLLNSSIVILNYALTLSHEVNSAFHSE